MRCKPSGSSRLIAKRLSILEPFMAHIVGNKAAGFAFNSEAIKYPQAIYRLRTIGHAKG